MQAHVDPKPRALFTRPLDSEPMSGMAMTEYVVILGMLATLSTALWQGGLFEALAQGFARSLQHLIFVLSLP